MIKFFRQIRYNLMETGKTGSSADRVSPKALAEAQTSVKAGKYLKYAIGEIVLVVIGILIALQINNWNEQRKADKLEAEYYCRLLEDLIQDSEQVDAVIKLSEDRLKASNQAVRLLQNKKAKKVEVGKQLGLSIIAIYSDFTPNNSAFEDLKSGANLNIIKDKNVIKSINNYFNKVAGYLSIIKVNANIALDTFYSENDVFNTGRIHSQMLTERFITGMEKDVYESMNLNYEETLTETMKYELLNAALTYISTNARQLQLYNLIKDEVNNLITILEQKCIE
ncbi:hypothetical protein NA63_2863 [Flavobacteriaceae bacterium MAR_2010_105]|nr:hypothetical protein NA63_2863 [Flavobacteriaceae bacterium MAR_2010_105]